jgi:hypothetical protein
MDERSVWAMRSFRRGAAKQEKEAESYDETNLRMKGKITTGKQRFEGISSKRGRVQANL